MREKLSGFKTICNTSSNSLINVLYANFDEQLFFLRGGILYACFAVNLTCNEGSATHVTSCKCLSSFLCLLTLAQGLASQYLRRLQLRSRWNQRVPDDGFLVDRQLAFEQLNLCDALWFLGLLVQAGLAPRSFGITRSYYSEAWILHADATLDETIFQRALW